MARGLWDDDAYQLTRGWMGDTAGMARLRHDANSGDICAQAFLAVSLDGAGEAAYGWYLKAANQGDPFSMMNVATILLHGLEGKLSVPEACTWLEKVALMQTMWSGEAASKLATYHRGAQSFAKDENGMPSRLPEIDHVAAVRWYKRADSLGDIDATYHLGDLHAQGAGVAVDVKAAMAFWKKASDAGHAEAPCSLGFLYISGLVPADEKKMLQWTKLAASRGSERAKGMLANHQPFTARQARKLRKDAHTDTDEKDVAAMNANIYESLLRCCSPECGRLEVKGQPKFKKCSGCLAVLYCSRACQKAHYRAQHKQECRSMAQAAEVAAQEPVAVPPKESPAEEPQCFKVLVGGGCWSELPVSYPRGPAEAMHPRPEVLPLPKLLGVDLTLQQNSPGEEGNENKEAALLSMDPAKNGLAPARWRGPVGRCTVARASPSTNQSYTTSDHGVLRAYLVKLRDKWATGTEPPTPEDLSPRGFQRFVREWLEAEYLDSMNIADLSRLTAVLAPRVKLKGLQKQPALNGCEGFRGRELPGEGRFQVFIDGGREAKVKPANFEVLEESPLLSAPVFTATSPAASKRGGIIHVI
jgi:TPR repeat protein